MKLQFKRITSGIISFVMTATVLLNTSATNDVTTIVNSADTSANDIIYGDITDDSVIDAFDLALVKRAVLNDTFVEKADLDGNEAVDADDVIYLQNYILGRIKSFPIYDKFDEDGDGISDYLEVEVFGTDSHKKDTDGDQLSDYFEIYCLDSDPQVAGKEATEDPDEDGLTNLEESKYMTDPLLADSDDDDISDYDEIEKYGTNPLKKDTDGDGLFDADEIKLNLDPCKKATNGTPDGERIIEQIVAADDPILSEINTEDNAYNLSLVVNASGCVDRCLEVISSGYSYAMKDGSAIGATPEFIYDENYEVQDITLKFEIKEEFRESVVDLFTENYSVEVDEDLKGIKRLNVFKYFEEINSIMPIETQYDVANNIVYVTITKDDFEVGDNGESFGIGSYSLVDLEVWAVLMNDGVEQEAETSLVLADTAPELSASTLENTPLSKIGFKERPENVLAAVFSNYVGFKKAGKTENNISNGMNVISFGGHKYAVINESCSWEDAKEKCESLGGHLMTPNTALEFAFLQYGLTSGKTSNHYWLGVHYTDSEWKWADTGERADFIYTLSKNVNGYNASIADYQRYVGKQFYYADGMGYTASSTLSANAFICEWNSNSEYYKGRTTAIGGVLVNAGIKKYFLKSALKKGSTVDTDNDGISDYNELDTKAMQKIGGTGTTAVSWLQTYNYLSNRYQSSDNKLFPAWENDNKICKALEDNSGASSSGGSVNTTPPSITTKYAKWEENPNNTDTDGDYYLDEVDEKTQKFDPMLIPDDYISDVDIMSKYPYPNDSKTTTPTLTVDNFGRSSDVRYKYPEDSDAEWVVEELDGGLTKGALLFERDPGSEVQFELTPDRNSDYKITVTFNNSEDAKKASEDDKFLSFNDDVAKIEEDNDCDGSDPNTIVYHYVLKANTKYKISLNSEILSGGITVSVTQDNWVYAPNGAFRSGFNSSDATSSLDELFLCQDTMIKLCESILKNHDQEDWENVRAQVEKNNKEALKYWIDSHKPLTDELNKSLELQMVDAESIIGKYNNISPSAQWVLEYAPNGKSGTLLGTISKVGDVAGEVLSTTDKFVFITERLYEAKCNQLPNAMIEGNFNICLYNNPTFVKQPYGAETIVWIAPILIPYSCSTWKSRDGVNGKYLSRYVSNGDTKHMRCTINVFD